jgi:hypothetical protein
VLYIPVPAAGCSTCPDSSTARDTGSLNNNAGENKTAMSRYLKRFADLIRVRAILY